MYDIVLVPRVVSSKANGIDDLDGKKRRKSHVKTSLIHQIIYFQVHDKRVDKNGKRVISKIRRVKSKCKFKNVSL
jgi:hypothetical protein